MNRFGYRRSARVLKLGVNLWCLSVASEDVVGALNIVHICRSRCAFCVTIGRAYRSTDSLRERLERSKQRLAMRYVGSARPARRKPHGTGSECRIGCTPDVVVADAEIVS